MNDCMKAVPQKEESDLSKLESKIEYLQTKLTGLRNHSDEVAQIIRHGESSPQTLNKSEDRPNGGTRLAEDLAKLEDCVFLIDIIQQDISSIAEMTKWT